MSKIIMLKGLPASGKTSKAKELMEASGNMIRVNRDLLRKMLHFDKWSWDNEQFVIKIEKAIALEALSKDTNVIVDDCNLNPRNEQMWREVARLEEAKFEVNHIYTPWVDCVSRDEVRQESVGGHVVKNMALQYGLVSLPKVCICDLDGTLCNIDHRLHFVKDKSGNPVDKKDWKGFFSEIQNDTLNESLKESLLNYQKEGSKIVYVSARPEEHRKVTEEWLKKNGCDFHFTLLMRGHGDRRDDVDVKKEMLNKYFPKKESIVMVFDDRPRVIRMWREQGIPVTDCGKGIEF